MMTKQESVFDGFPSLAAPFHVASLTALVDALAKVYGIVHRKRVTRRRYSRTLARSPCYGRPKQSQHDIARDPD